MTLYYRDILGKFILSLGNPRARMYTALDYKNHKINISVDEAHNYLLIIDEKFGLLIEAEYKFRGNLLVCNPTCKLNLDFFKN